MARHLPQDSDLLEGTERFLTLGDLRITNDPSIRKEGTFKHLRASFMMLGVERDKDPLPSTGLPPLQRAVRANGFYVDHLEIRTEDGYFHDPDSQARTIGSKFKDWELIYSHSSEVNYATASAMTDLYKAFASREKLRESKGSKKSGKPIEAIRTLASLLKVKRFLLPTQWNSAWDARNHIIYNIASLEFQTMWEKLIEFCEVELEYDGQTSAREFLYEFKDQIAPLPQK